MLNQVTIIGNLGRDPEGFDTRSGKGCRLSVATTRKWKDKATGELKEETEWHRCVVFGRSAEFCIDYLHKGRQVFVQGRLNTSSYEKDGVKHYSTDIIVDTVQGLGPKPADAGAKPAASAGYAQDGEDIPF